MTYLYLIFIDLYSANGPNNFMVWVNGCVSCYAQNTSTDNDRPTASLHDHTIEKESYPFFLSN